MTGNPHLNILVQLAKIDGETDEAELELIREIGASQNVSAEDIEEIIEKSEKETTLPSIAHLSDDAKAELMANLILMMKIDGRVHKEEMKFCFKVLKKLGYHEDVLFDMVSTTYVDPKEGMNVEEIKQKAVSQLNS